MSEIKHTIILDNGTSTIKAGFSGENQPRVTVPMMVGKPKPGSNMVGIQSKEYFVGHEAVTKQNLLDIVHPVENGIITNWQYIEQLWQSIFYDDLHIIPEDYSVLLSEKPMNTPENREKTIQVLFETFNVRSFFTCQQAVLGLFSVGKTTGIVLDAGEGLQHVVPVYEGYSIPHAIIKSELSGALLTEYMGKLLGRRVSDLPPACIRHIKEKLCYVPLDFQAEAQAAEQIASTRLPTGEFFECGSERFKCPELLFDPSLGDFEFEGIHQSIFNSIMKCDIDIRKDLYKNVLLCGGSSMFRGFSERVEKEIIALAPPSMKIRVFAPPERRNCVWLGGSVLGDRDFFSTTMAVSRKEYEESGAQIVHLKCHN
ncbi:actin [Tritrichomonas foetus]|uniref:Actin n=1 Tax=Tritrichomonas foetus TaxID=1144522 RepID=A0A1J4JHI5_9EUKA|nr:actin [Tritrichomonas foetus]|eukprot:OHS98598.1 actin [Tritrichomonas foetus]